MTSAVDLQLLLVRRQDRSDHRLRLTPYSAPHVSSAFLHVAISTPPTTPVSYFVSPHLR